MGGGMGRGMGNRENMQQQRQASFGKFSAEKIAGLIEYDEDEIIKKVKVKDKNTQNKIKNFVRNYNRQVLDLKLKYYKDLTDTDRYIQQKRKEAMLQKDFELMRQTRMEAREKLSPVRKESSQIQKELHENISSLLSIKQLKRWHKYIKQKNKTKNTQNNSFNRQGRQGSHRGMGGNHGRGRNNGAF